MKKTKAKNIILVLLAVLCVAVLLYTLYQGLIIYIPQKQEQQRFEELKQIVEREREESSAPVQTKPTGDDTQPVYTEEENPAVIFTAIMIRTIPFRERRSSAPARTKTQTRLSSMPII